MQSGEKVLKTHKNDQLSKTENITDKPITVKIFLSFEIFFLDLMQLDSTNHITILIK